MRSLEIAGQFDVRRALSLSDIKLTHYDLEQKLQSPPKEAMIRHFENIPNFENQIWQLAHEVNDHEEQSLSRQAR